jgi:hypothetical protein
MNNKQRSLEALPQEYVVHALACHPFSEILHNQVY